VEVVVLPSHHRLRKSEDFRAIRRTGKKYVYPGFIIHISQGFFGDQSTKIGITAGKDCGNSVARHRMSRRIRGAIAPLVHQLPPGSGVVIRALPAAADDGDLQGSLKNFTVKVGS
jgi:ribonuclease P protein component